MKDGAIVANTGHFNVEIDIPRSRPSPSSGVRCASSSRSSRWPTAAHLPAGDGRLVNLAAAEGHPAS
jgi:adenosylhomocysteinase